MLQCLKSTKATHYTMIMKFNSHMAVIAQTAWAKPLFELCNMPVIKSFTLSCCYIARWIRNASHKKPFLVKTKLFSADLQDISHRTCRCTAPPWRNRTRTGRIRRRRGRSKWRCCPSPEGSSWPWTFDRRSWGRSTLRCSDRRHSRKCRDRCRACRHVVHRRSCRIHSKGHRFSRKEISLLPIPPILEMT